MGSANEPHVSIEAAGKRYGDAWVVRGVTLRVEPGETFVLMGESGCGKSTTLRMINRLVEPTEGRVRVNGRDTREAPEWELRRGIGYVIQDVGLFAHYTVARNVALVPELLGWDRARVAGRVEELLELVGLPAREYGGRYPRELSGGQKQRIGIARALAADPPIVLLDEPFSALDPMTRERLQGEFRALSRTLGKTFVLVTHDVHEAVRLADRIAVLEKGAVLQCASPRELVRRPATPYVAALLGAQRFQLRLMTTTLAEACAGHADPAGEPGAGVTADRDDSVWEALAKMEQAGLGTLRITDGSAARVITRIELLRRVEAAPGDA